MWSTACRVSSAQVLVSARSELPSLSMARPPPLPPLSLKNSSKAESRNDAPRSCPAARHISSLDGLDCTRSWPLSYLLHTQPPLFAVGSLALHKKKKRPDHQKNNNQRTKNKHAMGLP